MPSTDGFPTTSSGSAGAPDASAQRAGAHHHHLLHEQQRDLFDADMEVNNNVTWSEDSGSEHLRRGVGDPPRGRPLPGAQPQHQRQRRHVPHDEPERAKRVLGPDESETSVGSIRELVVGVSCPATPIVRRPRKPPALGVHLEKSVRRPARRVVDVHCWAATCQVSQRRHGVPAPGGSARSALLPERLGVQSGPCLRFDTGITFAACLRRAPSADRLHLPEP